MQSTTREPLERKIGCSSSSGLLLGLGSNCSCDNQWGLIKAPLSEACFKMRQWNEWNAATVQNESNMSFKATRVEDNLSFLVVFVKHGKMCLQTA